MPTVEHFSGTSALLANHHTYLGHVAYTLTVIKESPGAPTGEFAFVTAPLDLSDYAELSLELADERWFAIDLKYQDPTQNIYTFEGTEVYREHGA